jgi:hypothetical protein
VDAAEAEAKPRRMRRADAESDAEAKPRRSRRAAPEDDA